MKIQSIKVIAVLLLLFVSGVGLRAQSVTKGSGSSGTVSSAPVATFTPAFRMVLPPSATAATHYVADFSTMGLGSDARAQEFFDQNSCNVISFSVIPNSGKVDIYLAKYDGYTATWTVAEWNNWLESRCESIRESQLAHAADAAKD